MNDTVRLVIIVSVAFVLIISMYLRHRVLQNDLLLAKKAAKAVDLREEMYSEIAQLKIAKEDPMWMKYIICCDYIDQYCQKYWAPGKMEYRSLRGVLASWGI